MDDEAIPELTGFPQRVRFRGELMQVILVEQRRADERLCLTCGTMEARQQVQITLVGEDEYERMMHHG